MKEKRVPKAGREDRVRREGRREGGDGREKRGMDRREEWREREK